MSVSLFLFVSSFVIFLKRTFLRRPWETEGPGYPPPRLPIWVPHTGQLPRLLQYTLLDCSVISSPCWASKSPRDPFQNAEASATSNAGVTGLIPGCRPKIPHCRVTCPPHLKKKKKKTKNRQSADAPASSQEPGVGSGRLHLFGLPEDSGVPPSLPTTDQVPFPFSSWVRPSITCRKPFFPLYWVLCNKQ